MAASRCRSRSWAKSCHEFRYYENLAQAPESSDGVAAAQADAEPPKLDPAGEMLKRAIKLLAETKGDPWVNKGSIWRMIKRLDPTFDTKDHGHVNFPAMVKPLDGIVEVKKGDSDQVVRLR